MNCEQGSVQVPEVADVLCDPCASFWLKNAIRSALERDAVDAATDAQVLAGVLAKRAADLLKRPLEAKSVAR